MTFQLWGATLHEFDVAFTDFLLFVESGLFACLLARLKTPENMLQRLFCALFVLLGISSLLGALFHAFFPAKATTPGGFVMWMLIGLSIGLAAVVIWYINAYILNLGRFLRVMPLFTGIYLLIFIYVLVFVSYQFKTIIAFYLPPMIVLAVVSFVRWRQTRAVHWLWMFMSIGLSFVAAAIQFLRIGIHPVYFNHNAVYHVVQGVALALLFLAFSRILKVGSLWIAR